MTEKNPSKLNPQEVAMPKIEAENFTILECEKEKAPNGNDLFKLIINYLGKNRIVQGTVVKGKFDIWLHGLEGKELPDNIQLAIQKHVLNLNYTPFSSAYTKNYAEAPFCEKCGFCHFGKDCTLY